MKKMQVTQVAKSQAPAYSHALVQELEERTRSLEAQVQQETESRVAGEISISRLEDAVRHTRRTMGCSQILRHMMVSAQVELMRGFSKWHSMVASAKELQTWGEDVERSVQRALDGQLSPSGPSHSRRRGGSSRDTRSPSSSQVEAMQQGLSASVQQICLLECSIGRLVAGQAWLIARVGLLTWRGKAHAETTVRSLSEAVAVQAEENASLRRALRDARQAQLEGSLSPYRDQPGIDPQAVAALQTDILVDAREELEEMAACVGELQREVATRTAQCQGLKAKEAELQQEVRAAVLAPPGSTRGARPAARLLLPSAHTHARPAV